MFRISQILQERIKFNDKLLKPMSQVGITLRLDLIV